eukprot:6212987-Pleurochrysis_carterae.AAC.2
MGTLCLLRPSAPELSSEVFRVTLEARTSLACVQTRYQDLNLRDNLGHATDAFGLGVRARPALAAKRRRHRKIQKWNQPKKPKHAFQEHPNARNSHAGNKRRVETRK